MMAVAQPSYLPLSCSHPCQIPCACLCVSIDGEDTDGEDNDDLKLESPFGWRSESFPSTIEDTFEEGESPTISFTASRISKIFAYIPIIGTLIGIWRACEAIREYQYFNNNNAHVDAPHPSASRSITWAVRGTLETIPGLGGILCIIADIVATILYSLFGGK